MPHRTAFGYGGDVETVIREITHKQFAQALVIIDHEYPATAAAHGYPDPL